MDDIQFDTSEDDLLYDKAPEKPSKESRSSSGFGSASPSKSPDQTKLEVTKCKSVSSVSPPSLDQTFVFHSTSSLPPSHSDGNGTDINSGDLHRAVLAVIVEEDEQELSTRANSPEKKVVGGKAVHVDPPKPVSSESSPSGYSSTSSVALPESLIDSDWNLPGSSRKNSLGSIHSGISAGPRTTSRTSIGSMMKRDEKLAYVRQHDFVSKQVFKSAKCSGCNGSIRFLGSCKKCVVCQATSHLDCTKKVPVPCIPLPPPERKTGKGPSTVTDFAPKVRPSIPPLILGCIQEIEKRGRVFTADMYWDTKVNRTEVRSVTDALVKHKKGPLPDLSKRSLNTLAAVVRQFLSSLDEPLVSTFQWRYFAQAVDYEDRDDRFAALITTLDGLSFANKDTLAYLMKHFLTLVEVSSDPETTVQCLVKTFAPSIVGFSGGIPRSQSVEAEEKKVQNKVLTSLFKDVPMIVYENLLLRLTPDDKISDPLQRLPQTDGHRKNIRVSGRDFKGDVSFGPFNPLE